VSELRKVLENLSKIEGVKGSLVLGRSGEILERVFMRDEDALLVGTLASCCVNVGQNLGQVLSKSSLVASLLEYQDVSLAMEVLSGGAVLVVIAPAGTNQGKVRLEIKKNRKVLENIIA
jgi:predicted regulator of Ras-like GTPase activity (Roadblock/LC7/MglB family)